MFYKTTLYLADTTLEIPQEEAKAFETKLEELKTHSRKRGYCVSRDRGVTAVQEQESLTLYERKGRTRLVIHHLSNFSHIKSPSLGFDVMHPFVPERNITLEIQGH